MEPITVDALTTVGGLALVTGIIVFIVRRAADLSGVFMDRFGALLAVGIAIVLGVIAGLWLGADVFQMVLNGLVAGLTAAGGYDVLNGASKAT